MKNVRFQQFLIRLKCCWYILRYPKNSWAFISIDSENLRALLDEEAIDAQLIRHRLQEYNFYRLLQKIGNSKSDVDMLLAKLQFENDAQEYLQNKRKNEDNK